MSAQQRLLNALANGGFPQPDSIVEASTPIASPMRLALEWQGFLVSVGVQRFYAKVLLEDAAALIDIHVSATASRVAGVSGAAPLLLLADMDQGVLLFQALPPGEWRSACVDDLIAPQSLSALWALKRKVHRGSAAHAQTEPLPTRDPEQDIVRLHAMCLRDNAHLPADTNDIHQALLTVCHTLRATQTASVSVHGDGVTSNVMVRESGELMLVDFDRGGMADPWFDIASTLNELAELPAAWREGIAAWQGHCSDADYARCRLYGLVDDWYWTLCCLWLSATSPRQHDFMKLAQWTLLRLRQGLKENRLDAWLSLIVQGGTAFATATAAGSAITGATTGAITGATTGATTGTAATGEANHATRGTT